MTETWKRKRGPRKYAGGLVRWSATHSAWRQLHLASWLKATMVVCKKRATPGMTNRSSLSLWKTQRRIMTQTHILY